MPIYAYKCESCGHAKDVLQKMSDALLTDCPQCGAATLKKQLTAAGFQLKGSGWYVTDFRGGDQAGAPAAKGAEPGAASAASPELAAAAPAPSGTAPAATSSAAPASVSPKAAASAPASAPSTSAVAKGSS